MIARNCLAEGVDVRSKGTSRNNLCKTRGRRLGWNDRYLSFRQENTVEFMTLNF